jgi:hypothetical protein
MWNSMSSNDSPTAADPYRVHMLVLAVVTLSVFVFLGKTCVKHGAFKVSPDGRPQGSDFTAYYSAGELARRGVNIYDYQSSSTPFRPYIYPPMFAVFPMAPLSLLPHDTACAIFYIFNVLLLWVGMWLVWRILDFGFRILDCPPPTQISFWRRPEIGAFLAVVVCWRFLDDNLKVGNANLYIFFLLALALFFLAQQSNPKSPFTSGLSIALATTFKITPGLFGLYFLWSARRWAMAGGAAGLILFLFIAPGLVIGFGENWRDLAAFAGNVREKTMSEEDDTPVQKGEIVIGRPKKAPTGELPRAVGISIRGTVMKLLSPTQALTRGEIEGKGNINIVDLEPRQAQTIANVLSLLLLILTIVATYPRWTREGVFPLALSWSLVTVAMLLVAPMTRVAHAVVLLIPVSVLIAVLQRDLVAGARRKLAWIALGAICFGSILGSADIIGKHGSQVIHAAGLDTALLLLLYVAILAALLQLKGLQDNRNSSGAKPVPVP